MPNIKIIAEVDGKIVPLNTISTESFEAIKALEKPKEIPVARTGFFTSTSNKRLFLRVTDGVKKVITKANPYIICINLETGDLINTRNNWDEVTNAYENVQSL